MDDIGLYYLLFILPSYVCYPFILFYIMENSSQASFTAGERSSPELNTPMAGYPPSYDAETYVCKF